MFDCCVIFVVKWVFVRSKLVRHFPRRRGVVAHIRPCLLLLVRHRQVAEKGFRPDMTLWACNYPQITGPVLSREHAEAEVGRLLQKRKADVA